MRLLPEDWVDLSQLLLLDIAGDFFRQQKRHRERKRSIASSIYGDSDENRDVETVRTILEDEN